jgi:MtN3 and saliva related transmembrane protein
LKTDEAMDLELMTGIAAGCFTTASTIPQIVKTIQSKDAKDVSVWMFSVLLTGVSLWTVYGVMKSDVPIVVFNSISVVLNVVMLVLKVRYK